MPAGNFDANGDGAVAVKGTATGDKSLGVFGTGQAVGVRGDGATWHGVSGHSKSTTGGAGVQGQNDNGAGVRGVTKARYNPGVHGQHQGEEGAGVQGDSKTGAGVIGISEKWIGVYGATNGDRSTGPSGVLGDGKQGGVGVKGQANGEGIPAVAGYHMSHSGPGIFGKGSPAGFFDGDVHVTGDVRLVGADVAEEFDILGTEPAEPGSVMVLAGEDRVRLSDTPYDRRVAGVVSGAGNFRPSIVLDTAQRESRRQALALSGKVWVLVDADYGAVDVGDLLTSSATAGHAMRASDPSLSFGAVLGKALDPLSRGRGLIRALVALQ